MFTSGRDLCQAVQVNQLLAWNTAVHQLLNISLFSFPVPPAVARYVQALFFWCQTKLSTKRNFLFSSNYFIITKLPRFFPLPLLRHPCQLYGVSNSEQSMGRWFPKTTEEEQSYLPMLSFYLLWITKNTGMSKKSGFACLRGICRIQAEDISGFFCSQPGSHFTKWPFGVSPGWLLRIISQARVEESFPPHFVLSILRRLKGHVSLQEYREQGRVLQ